MSKRRAGSGSRGKTGTAGLPAFPGHLTLPPEPVAPNAPLSDRETWRRYYEACVARTRSVHALLRRNDQQRLQAAAARSPLDYRRQHPAISRDRDAVVVRTDHQVQDADGRPGDPHKAFDTLAALHRRGSIGDVELDAGRRFEEEFRRALLDPLRASDLARLPGPSGSDASERAYHARQVIDHLMRALGGRTAPVGACIWSVLGEGKSLRQFAQSTVFGSGRSMSEKAASWTLIGGLGILASAYGMTARSGARRTETSL